MILKKWRADIIDMNILVTVAKFDSTILVAEKLNFLEI